MHINDGPPGGREGGSDVDRALQLETNRQEVDGSKSHVISCPYLIACPQASCFFSRFGGWLVRSLHRVQIEGSPIFSIVLPLVPFPAATQYMYMLFVSVGFTFGKRQVQRDLSWNVSPTEGTIYLRILNLYTALVQPSY